MPWAILTAKLAACHYSDSVDWNSVLPVHSFFSQEDTQQPDEQPSAEADLTEVPQEAVQTETVQSEPIAITLSFAEDCTLGMDQSFYYDSSFNAMYDYQGAAYFCKM